MTPVLLAEWLVSLTSDREVPGSIPTGSRFFCAVTRGTGYSWPGMRVKCILYTVGYIILGRNARLYFDVKLKYLYLFTFLCLSTNLVLFLLFCWLFRASGRNGSASGVGNVRCRFTFKFDVWTAEIFALQVRNWKNQTNAAVAEGTSNWSGRKRSGASEKHDLQFPCQHHMLRFFTLERNAEQKKW